VVTRATLRLSPIPQASASVAVRFASAEQAFAALMPLLRQAPLPAAADWLGCPGPEGELLLRFDGEPAGVAYQRDRAVLVLRANSGAGALRDAIDDESVWIERRNVFTRLSRQSPIRLRIGVPPGRAGEAAKLLQTGRIPSADWTCGYLGSGILIAGFERAPSSDAIRQLQTQATAIGGYLSLEAGPPQLRNALLPHESMAPSAVREGLAKGRVFNPHIRL
jgi:FAD/FMN-containing dehydrogenase